MAGFIGLYFKKSQLYYKLLDGPVQIAQLPLL